MFQKNFKALLPKASVSLFLLPLSRFWLIFWNHCSVIKNIYFIFYYVDIRDAFRSQKNFTNNCSKMKTISDTPLPMPRIIKAENVIIPYMYMYMYKYDFKLQQNGNEDLRKQKYCISSTIHFSSQTKLVNSFVSIRSPAYYNVN